MDVMDFLGSLNVQGSADVPSNGSYERSRPDEQSRANFRIVKILRTKCLVGWPNVNRSRNPVIVDVVQKFYFLMFTGINV